MKKFSNEAVVEYHVRSWFDLPAESRVSCLVPMLRLISGDIYTTIPAVLPQVRAPFTEQVLCAWKALMHHTYKSALGKMDRLMFEESILDAVRNDPRLLQHWVSTVEQAATLEVSIKKDVAANLIRTLVTEIMPHKADGLLQSSTLLDASVSDTLASSLSPHNHEMASGPAGLSVEAQ